MPKLLVLYYGAETPAVALAEVAAEGAKQVRFAEVDLRAGAPHQANSDRRHRQLPSPNDARSYDGIVLACQGIGDISADARTLFDAMERMPGDAFSNTVFGLVGGENTALLGRVARLGGILVGEPRGIADPEARARAHGKRVAQVVEWVRHALSHEGHHDQHSQHHHYDVDHVDHDHRDHH